MQPSITDQLQQEYDRFVEFGNLLDRRTRKYLVEYLHHQIAPDEVAAPERSELEELNDRYFQYFRQALNELFALQDLLDLCRGNQRISQQVILDTLYWLRKIYDKVQTKNPYQKEADLLENYAVTPLHVFIRRWHVLVNFLQQNYAREDLDTYFYRDRFQTLITTQDIDEVPPENRERLELLLTDLLSQWDARLQAKILDHQLTKLEEEKEEYLELIAQKVKEYKRLIDLVAPFSEYLGWDLSRELWNDTSLDILQRYDDLLQDERSVQELADLLGRMREAEIEIEEETFERTIIRQEWINDETAKAEIVGVHGSDDLNNLLSSEAGLLSDAATEDLFLQRFADKGLLTFRYEDKKLVKSENQVTEVNQRIRQKEKGPFIVCVDTSESMTGRPEQIAKVLCLGVLKMAIRENRRAFLINFSIGIQTLDLYDIANSIDEIARFLRLSFHGGTDVSLALQEAVRQLRSNDYAEADVLVVSDFIMQKIDKDVLQEVRHFQQNKETQFHSLTIGENPNDSMLRIFDTNWVYDPEKKGVIKELTKGLQAIGERK